MALDQIYIDTSALMKRFVVERASAEVEALLTDGQHTFMLSTLSLTEFNSVLKRLVRAGHMQEVPAGKIRQQFELELATGFWQLYNIGSAQFGLAASLINRLESPLATLDALHLAAAQSSACMGFASADKQLVRAAKETGFEVFDFS